MQLQELKTSLNNLNILEATELLAIIRKNRNTSVVSRKSVTRTPKEKSTAKAYGVSKKQEELFKKNPELLKKLLEQMIEERDNESTETSN